MHIFFQEKYDVLVKKQHFLKIFIFTAEITKTIILFPAIAGAVSGVLQAIFTSMQSIKFFDFPTPFLLKLFLYYFNSI